MEKPDISRCKVIERFNSLIEEKNFIDIEISKIVAKALNENDKKLLAYMKDKYLALPSLSHSYTKTFNNAYSSSFKIKKMANDYLMNRFIDREDRLRSKESAKTFASMCGLKYPKTFFKSASFLERTHLLPNVKSFVVKPGSGASSVNVFGILRQSGGGLKDIFSGRFFESESSFLDFLINIERGNKFSGDGWVCEELVFFNQAELSPAKDVKFFCFYGKVVLILQIDDRWSGKQSVMFGVDGVPLDVGRYGKPSGMEKPFFSNEDIKVIEDFSLNIPFPFCRIDFLKSGENLYFGELTFNVGAPGKFDDVFDKMLGDEYRKAEVRLYEDFLKGKDWTAFKDIVF